jgi:hypothetical protein
MRRGVVARVVAVVVATMAFVGCRADTRVDVAMSSDGSGTVTVTVVVDAEIVAAEPNLAAELHIDDLTTSGWTAVGPTPTAAGGLQLVLARPFTNIAEANAVLSQLSGANGPLKSASISVDAAAGEVQWNFSGQLDLSAGLSAFADQDLLTAVGGVPWGDVVVAKTLAPADAATMTMAVSLPGRVVADGETSLPAAGPGWTARAGDPAVAMAVRGVATSPEVLHARKVQHRYAMWLVFYLLLVGALVGAWFLARSRRRPISR